MNLTPFDWLLVAGVLAVMLAGVEASRRHMHGVADFLAANRTAGRYVLSLSQGLAALGAITIVGNFEMNYVAGFAMSWWGFTMSVVVLAIAVSGWVIYRFRQTRCLTLAEFFERRYSRNFRVFAGFVAFFSGLVNFGIFPAVGARFFVHFCGLPSAVTVLGLGVPTYPLVMIALLATALWFVYAGGQVAVIIVEHSRTQRHIGIIGACCRSLQGCAQAVEPVGERGRTRPSMDGGFFHDGGGNIGRTGAFLGQLIAALKIDLGAPGDIDTPQRPHQIGLVVGLFFLGEESVGGLELHGQAMAVPVGDDA